MPTTIEMQAYKFQELTDTAKQEVITRLAPDYDWWESDFGYAIEQGKDKGFEIEDIKFSGFYSQGDGACWEGKVIVSTWLTLNRPADARAHVLLALLEDGWLSDYLRISHGGSRYLHEQNMRDHGLDVISADENDKVTSGMFAGISVMNLQETISGEYLTDLEKEMLEDARSYARDIYRDLQKSYEHMCSEEYIAETCDANEYLFTIDGKHFV